MANAELRKILNTYFYVNEASGYALDHSNFYMEKNTTFHRDEIQKYASVFLTMLKRNPNFLNPCKGGTTSKQINEMFITGMQPPALDQALWYRTVKDTFTAVRTELPFFQAMINKGLCNPIIIEEHKQAVTKTSLH